MSFTLDLSDEEFNRTLEEIDLSMTSQDMAIPFREIRGWMLFCQRQQLEGISMLHPISKKVIDWFSAKYGDRLNLESNFGHSVVLLRGEIIRFKCPRFWGGALMICCPVLVGQIFDNLTVNQPVVMNVLKQMDGVTPTFSQSLTLDERERLLETITESQIRLARIDDAGMGRFVPEARADISTSVELLMLNDRQWGPSKWASLQAVEKFLKGYISQQGTEPKRIHELDELADRAESLGLRALNRNVLSLVQCSPSARYEASSVTKAEAVKAHHAAISACAEIATQLKGRSKWNTGALQRGLLGVNGTTEKVPTILIARINQEVEFNCEIEADH